MLIYEQSSLSWKQRRENWLCMNCASAKGTIIICTISTQAENEISIIRWWEREQKEIVEQFTKYTVAVMWKTCRRCGILEKTMNMVDCSLVCLSNWNKQIWYYQGYYKSFFGQDFFSLIPSWHQCENDRYQCQVSKVSACHRNSLLKCWSIFCITYLMRSTIQCPEVSNFPSENQN